MSRSNHSAVVQQRALKLRHPIPLLKDVFDIIPIDKNNILLSFVGQHM